MSRNRYGRIYHSDFNYINLRFESLDKRRVFEAKFNAYHAEHEHDGEVPRFEEITASEAIKEAVKDADSVTIDGYTPHEIEAYHEDEHGGRWVKYKPPTTCVAPIISIDRIFVASDTLKRHELSAIFTDMPEADYQSLLESVEKDGFMDPVIRLIGNEVLDGWHRYRAAKELNLLRKLVFRQWNEKDEGDPAAFVLARNIERRHLDPGQRAQIVVRFNNRLGHGGDRTESKSPNGDLKTRQQLAKDAGVGTSTIDRAVAVEKSGESEAVIRGEKTAGEIIKENESNCKKELRRILDVQGVLNKSVYDARALSESYNLTEARVRKLKDGVWGSAITKARERWQKSYTKVRSAWMNNAALSTSVEWETFIAATLEQVDMASLSQETFTEADSRIKSCVDYQLLQREANCLITLGCHLRNPSVWVSELIPQSIRDEYKRKELWEKIDARLPQWKERLPVEHQEVPVEYFTKDLLIATFREGAAERQKDITFMTFKIGEPGTQLSMRELDELRCHVQNETYWLIYAVRKALIAGTEKLLLQDTSETGIDLEYLQSVVNRSRMRFWRARERLTDFARVAPGDFAKAAVESLGLPEDATAYLFEGVEDPLLDLPVSELTCWQSRFDILTGQIEKEVGWVVEVMRLTSEDTEKSDALEKFRNQKADLYARIADTSLISVKDEFGNVNADKARHRVMAAAHKAYDLSEDLLWSDPAVEALSAEELRKMTGSYFLMVQDFVEPHADWVAELYQKAKIADTDTSEVEQNHDDSEADATLSSVAELLGENREMWGISIEWHVKDLDNFEGISFLNKPRDPRNLPLSMLSERLIAELLTLAMPAQAENAALGWEAGYEPELRKSFNEAFDAWEKRHTSDMKNVEKLTGKHVCKAYQLKMRKLQTNVITPSDYRATYRAMKNDDKRLLEGLYELYGGSQQVEEEGV